MLLFYINNCKLLERGEGSQISLKFEKKLGNLMYKMNCVITIVWIKLYTIKLI